jgi:hypothetical protein
MRGRELCTLDEERVLSEARTAVDDLYTRTGVERPVPWPVL